MSESPRGQAAAVEVLDVASVGGDLVPGGAVGAAGVTVGNLRDRALVAVVVHYPETDRRRFPGVDAVRHEFVPLALFPAARSRKLILPPKKRAVNGWANRF